MSAGFDAAVLGADLEGLAAAATLARAGRRVVVLDHRKSAGGSSAKEEFHPGYHVPGLLSEVGGTRRSLATAFGLDDFGLQWRRERPKWLLREGRGFVVERGAPTLPGELGADTQAYAQWRAFLDRVHTFANGILDTAPPEAFDPGAKEIWSTAMRGLELRRLGERDMFELLRIGPLPAADWLDDHFESDALKVFLTAPALLGTVLGPRAAGTGALLLARECTLGPEPVGGAPALVEAWSGVCDKWGAQVRLETGVERVRVERGAATGVELESGEIIETETVLSAWSPRRTFLDLIESRQLPSHLEHAAETWRARGSVAIARIALSHKPEFAGSGVERACSATSMVELERTADALKYNELAASPWVDVWVPTEADSGLAPAGHAVLVVTIHGAPAGLAGGWTPAARKELEERMWSALDALLPDARQHVVATELLAPPDLEERYGLTGGHVYQGELALDQLWLQRPTARLARYATGIRGLYLCGPSSHPGGPFPCGAGILAARAALVDSGAAD